MRRLIGSGSSFEAEIGYSRAVVQGDWVFVSGTTGFDYAAMTISDDIVQQTEQALRNIEAALTEARASLADVVRVTYMLPDAAEFPRCFGNAFDVPQVLGLELRSLGRRKLDSGQDDREHETERRGRRRDVQSKETEPNDFQRQQNAAGAETDQQRPPGQTIIQSQRSRLRRRFCRGRC